MVKMEGKTMQLDFCYSVVLNYFTVLELMVIKNGTG